MSLVRTALVPVDGRIRSSYDNAGKTGGPRAGLRALASLGSGSLAPDAAAGLLLLDEAVADAGGDLRITDALRRVASQKAAREKYDRWQRDKAKGIAYDSRIHKSAYVAYPGASFHGAGRAIDVHIDMLGFPGVASNRQLDRLWDIARPIGWEPIIAAPTEGVSESWHFDYMGPWRPVRARLGYEAAARAANLDVGEGWDVIPSSTERFIQGQLHRAGFDCGGIDGVIGARTRRCLGLAGVESSAPLSTIAQRVAVLPDSAILLGS